MRPVSVESTLSTTRSHLIWKLPRYETKSEEIFLKWSGIVFTDFWARHPKIFENYPLKKFPHQEIS